MNTDIMNTQIFHLNKYDKVIEGHKSSSYFSVRQKIKKANMPLIKIFVGVVPVRTSVFNQRW